MPPWELVKQPMYWLKWASVCMEAEQELQARDRKKQERQAKQRGR